ncbi:MAG: hypothetical protein V2B18_14260 [Pseudomonadota bacterium]
MKFLGYLETYTVFFPRWTLTRSSGFSCAQVTTSGRLDLCHKRGIFVPGDFFFRHSKILPTVRFFMKHVHRARTTLHDMMWIAGNHNAGQTSHRSRLGEGGTPVQKMSFVSPDFPCGQETAISFPQGTIFP